jgi:hypothetical protein
MVLHRLKSFHSGLYGTCRSELVFCPSSDEFFLAMTLRTGRIDSVRNAPER